MLITLTADGRALIDEALPAVLNAEAAMIDTAVGSRSDQERLAALLRRVVLALDGAPRA